MSIADQLTALNNVKLDIKQSLIDKGLSPSDVFSSYATDIDNITGGGITLTATAKILTDWEIVVDTTLGTDNDVAIYTYRAATIKWGDGNEDVVAAGSSTAHTYATEDSFSLQVVVNQTGSNIRITDGQEKVTTVKSFGIKYSGGSIRESFKLCSNLTSVPADLPPSISSAYYCFSGCSLLNDPNMIGWDVSTCNDMRLMFVNCSSLNQDLSGWQTPLITSKPENFDLNADSWDEWNKPTWGHNIAFLNVNTSLEATLTKHVFVYNPVTLTAYGNAEISDDYTKVGTTSGNFAGVNDYLKVDDSRFAIGDDDFTIEGWFYKESASTGDFSGMVSTLNDDAGAANNSGVGLVIIFGNIGLQIGVDDGSLFELYGSAIPTDQWVHLAATRSGTDIKLYINGVVDQSTTATVKTITNTNLIVAGLNGTGWQGNITNKYLDEVRVSNTARYSGNFTPSSTPYSVDNNTLLLLHMDGVAGSTTFTDGD